MHVDVTLVAQSQHVKNPLLANKHVWTQSAQLRLYQFLQLKKLLVA
jgi:hypothetical protein